MPTTLLLATPLLPPLSIFLMISAFVGSGCVVIHGDEITPGDLAVAIPAFHRVAHPDFPLGPAPKPGLRQRVNQTQLTSWLNRSGAPNKNGARYASELVRNGDDARSSLIGSDLVLPSTVCVERERFSLTEELVEEAIRASLGDREAVLLVEGFGPDLLPPGRLSFSLDGATRPSPIHPDAPFSWRGSWVVATGAAIPVWARVRAYRPSREVRLRLSLPAGSQLNEAQMEIVEGVRSVFDEQREGNTRWYSGKLLKRFCARGTLLNAAIVESAPLIRKDSLVSVDVISGSLHLRLTARAKTDGRDGQVIPFVIPAGHREFRAQVEQDGHAVLFVGQTIVGQAFVGQTGERGRGALQILPPPYSPPDGVGSERKGNL